jgi:AcrR family transcriptional regulator
MSIDQPTMRKGERTAQKILDAAEERFADKGYERTSLREIAEEVGIQEPGLYRHFANKEVLYKAVLERALNPLHELLQTFIEEGAGNEAQLLSKESIIALPAQVFDVFVEHPSVALLFHQVLVAEEDAQNPMEMWIKRFFEQALDIVNSLPDELEQRISIDSQTLALRILALFNVSIGYFSASRVSTHLLPQKNEGELIERQKELLTEMMRSWL